MTALHTAFVGLGANLGEARAQVLDAIDRLDQLPGTSVTHRASLYSSAPIDSSGDDYVNTVVRVQTELSAQALLAGLQAIEQAHGRERPYRNAPRTLDLDLLLYDELQQHDPQLELPHPRMHQRAFVLLPLLELAPEVQIPGLGPAAQYLPGVADQVLSKLI